MAADEGEGSPERVGSSTNLEPGRPFMDDEEEDGAGAGIV